MTPSLMYSKSIELYVKPKPNLLHALKSNRSKFIYFYELICIRVFFIWF